MVPISNLTALTLRLLRTTGTRSASAAAASHDALRRQLEVQVVPVLVRLGADMTRIVASKFVLVSIHSLSPDSQSD